MTEEMETGQGHEVSLTRIVRRLWVPLVAVIVVFVGLGLVAAVLQPVRYTAHAELVVVATGGDSASDAVANEQLASSRAQTFAALAGSEAVAADVAKRLGNTSTTSELLEHVTVESAPELPTFAISASGSSQSEAVSLARTWVESLQQNGGRWTGSDDSGSDISVKIVDVSGGVPPVNSSRIGFPVLVGSGAGIGLIVAAVIVLYAAAARTRP